MEARLRSGKSQAEVAREVGIVQGSVSNYEWGREPSLSIAARLAESLGVALVSLRHLGTPEDMSGLFEVDLSVERIDLHAPGDWTR